MDQRINDSLKELEQSLKNLDSARKQVESKHPTPILAVWTISATFAPC